MNNTIERTSEIKTTAIFSKDLKHRYCLKIEWNNKKKSCAILMTYPSTADEFILDQTTMLVRNGAIKNDFGSVSIVNIFSLLEAELPKSDRINASVVLRECSDADIILVAFGRNTAHQEQKERMLEMLTDYKDKLHTIIDKNGSPYSHPLSPKAREWKIEKLKI
ncbi:MAG: DUF1643 domain-containing protein [Clostridia bacterium]|nr:DUF1643 domain-containing protein [Clostridia bacterium]